MKSREEIAKKYFPCTCGEIYLSRNLTAPDCPFHAFDWDGAFEEYAQQSQPSGMRWVRASERMPEKYKTIVMRVEKMPELTGNGYSDGNVFWWSGPKKQNIYYNIQDVEWLDESSPAGADEVKNSTGFVSVIQNGVANFYPAGAAEGASEGMAEAVRECINHGAFTFYCNTNNCICCSECKMPLTQSELKEKLASLSPGVEDNQTKKQ